MWAVEPGRSVPSLFTFERMRKYGLNRFLESFKVLTHFGRNCRNSVVRSATSYGRICLAISGPVCMFVELACARSPSLAVLGKLRSGAG